MKKVTQQMNLLIKAVFRAAPDFASANTKK